MRVRLPCLPLSPSPRPSPGVPGEGAKVKAPMVKRISSHASNLGFRVQILVGVLFSGEPLASVLQRARQRLAAKRNRWCLWCRGLACDPVKVVVAGSIPPGHPFIGVCSWESRRSPKPLDTVRICALLLPQGLTSPARHCRRGSIEKGSGPVNRLMLVRIQPSALKQWSVISG